MENTRNHDTAERSPAFTFATNSPWIGPDVETMRIHSRARVLQSQNRANRLGRHDPSLRIMLEAARAERSIEAKIALDVDRRDQDALRDLARGSHRDSYAELTINPNGNLRHLAALRDTDDVREISLVDDEKESQSEIDLRERHALTELRRAHERAHQKSLTVLRDAQPRSAAKYRRWG